MIKCEICGKELLSITNSHLLPHKLTQAEYKVLYPQVLISSNETRTKLSQTMKKKRADPLSSYNAPVHHQRQSKSHKSAWANPDSRYNSPEFAKKISISVTKRFKDDATYSKRVGIAISKLFADPNSTYNSPQHHAALKAAWADPNSGHNSVELSRKLSIWLKSQWANPYSPISICRQVGFGNWVYSSDGHPCQSRFELIFEEWLIDNSIEHIPHPPIPNNPSRRADQLISGKYIEIDGMSRTKDYWNEKYSGTNINPLIISSKELTREFLDKNLLEPLRGGH